MSAKSWTPKATKLLKASLEKPRHELNELDWKAALSPDKKRLAEHLSALANHPGGGYLLFGVDSADLLHGFDCLVLCQGARLAEEGDRYVVGKRTRDLQSEAAHPE